MPKSLNPGPGENNSLSFLPEGRKRPHPRSELCSHRPLLLLPQNRHLSPCKERKSQTKNRPPGPQTPQSFPAGRSGFSFVNLSQQSFRFVGVGGGYPGPSPVLSASRCHLSRPWQVGLRGCDAGTSSGSPGARSPELETPLGLSRRT